MGETEELPVAWSPQLADAFSLIGKLLEEDLLDRFRLEISDSLIATISRHDPKYLNETVEAWHRLLLFKQEGRVGRTPDPASGDQPAMTAKEVRAYLGV